MKEEEKVRQITKNEARKIDPSKVAYFTLSDGTVFIVKENIKQENQNVPQEQEQIQTTSQNEQINIPAYSQNTQEIQQQENNIGYNISSEGENIQQNSCCKSRLISAQYIGQNTYIQQGPRRQFYKLIQAIPVRFCDIQGVQFMNQNTNSQIYLQRYNNGTYIVDRSSKDNLSNYQVNTQTSGINKFCSCGGRIENVETDKKVEEQKVVKNEENIEEQVNEQQVNEQQVEEQVNEQQANEEQVEEQLNEQQVEEQVNEQQVEEQVNEQQANEEQVEEQAEEQVEEQAEEQAEEQVEEQAEEQAEEQVEEQVEEQAEEQVEEQVEEHAEEQVEEQVEEQAEEQAEEQVEEQVEEQAEEQVEEQVNNEQVEEVKVKHTKVCCCPIGNPALREEMEIISPELYEKMKKLKKL